jgi:hypothetical protein
VFGFVTTAVANMMDRFYRKHVGLDGGSMNPEGVAA